MLKVGLTKPIDLDTFWEFQGLPVAVTFEVTGWSSSSGLSGELHVGSMGATQPIHMGMSDYTFVGYVNTGKLVQVELTPEI